VTSIWCIDLRAGKKEMTASGSVSADWQQLRLPINIIIISMNITNPFARSKLEELSNIDENNPDMQISLLSLQEHLLSSVRPTPRLS